METLTKREQIASQLLAGLMANSYLMKAFVQRANSDVALLKEMDQGMIKSSIEMADGLLLKLQQTK